MQWGLIFGGASTLDKFTALQNEEQAIIGAAYLYRQKRLLEQFDSCYSENRTELFEDALIACVSGDEVSVDLVNRVDSSIPDTEGVAEQEGAYAQNLLIALGYLLSFSASGQHEFFERSVSMAAENIDLVNYEADSSYDEAAVLAKERLIASSLIDKLPEGRKQNLGLDLLAWLCGDNWI